MRLLVVAGTLVLAVIMPLSATLAETQRAGRKTPSSVVIDHAGRYVSPDGTCHARLKIASMGGFLVLAAGRSTSRKLKVDGVTGMAWVGGHTLVYTTSPIYGVPGLYVYGCDSSRATRIVAPRTVTKAYPDGDDFFELKRVSAGKPATAYFYYAPDVEKVDFTKFRTPTFLFQVHLDGTDFHRAAGQ
jgi:hypothetical protein